MNIIQLDIKQGDSPSSTKFLINGKEISKLRAVDIKYRPLALPEATFTMNPLIVIGNNGQYMLRFDLSAFDKTVLRQLIKDAVKALWELECREETI